MKKSKKIFVSGRPYFGLNAGITRYARIYINELCKICKPNEQRIIGIFQNPPCLPVPDNMEVIIASQIFQKIPPTLFERIIAPIYYRLHGADLIMNFSGLGAPWFTRKITVSTFYDIIIDLCPETMAVGTRLLFWMFWRRDFLNARYRIVISKSLLDRVESGKISKAERTEIIRCPFGMNYEEALAYFKSETDKITQRSATREKYLLAIGSIEPRKRYDLLIESFLKFRSRSESNIKLKICGSASWGLDKNGMFDTEHVELLENVSNADLVKLYANCSAVVSAELYSGYGSTLYEARLLGIPVLINNVPEFREAAGSMATVTNYADVDDIVDKFQCVINAEHKEPQPEDINLSQGAARLQKIINELT